MSNQRIAGVVGAVGLIIQIILGFSISGGVSAVLSPMLITAHMVIGLSGVALVAYLVARVYYVGSGGLKFLYFITFILVLAQVALGFRLLTAADQQLVMSHEGAAIAVLILLALSEMTFARQRKVKTAAALSSAPK